MGGNGASGPHPVGRGPCSRPGGGLPAPVRSNPIERAHSKSLLAVLSVALLSLLLPTAASATPAQVIADCNADGDLDRRYSARDYSSALAQNAEEAQYSGNCLNVIRQARATARTIRVRRGVASVRVYCSASGRARLRLRRNGSATARCRARRTVSARVRVPRPGSKVRATVTLGGERVSFVLSLKR